WRLSSSILRSRHRKYKLAERVCPSPTCSHRRATDSAYAWAVWLTPKGAPRGEIGIGYEDTTFLSAPARRLRPPTSVRRDNQFDRRHGVLYGLASRKAAGA